MGLAACGLVELVGALCGEGSAVDAGGGAGGGEGVVGEAFPELSDALGGALLAHADDALAGVHVTIPEHEVAMGVVGIAALVVEGGEPRGLPAGQLLGEAADQFDPPLGVEFAGQGEHDLVDNAGVLAVGPLLTVHPGAGAPDPARAGHGHVLAHDLGAGALAGDVLHVGAGGAGAVGGASDGGVVEREHPDRSPAPIPASRGASRTPSRRASHEPPEDARPHIWVWLRQTRASEPPRDGLRGGAREGPRGRVRRPIAAPCAAVSRRRSAGRIAAARGAARPPSSPPRGGGRAGAAKASAAVIPMPSQERALDENVYSSSIHS